MKDIKIQIRVAVETREEWKRLASASHKTLTQYIVDKVEGVDIVQEKSLPKEPIVRAKIKKAKRGLKELPSQDMGGFITRFK